MNVNSEISIGTEELFFYDDFNSSYTYDEYCCGGPECDLESILHFDSIFIPVLFSLVVVVGLVGNGLVMVVLWKKRLSLNITDIFILHLSLADTLLLLTLPFLAVKAVKGWIFGTALCRLTEALFKISFFCGTFMLSCISLDRYLSIVHAVQMYSRKKPVVIHCCCLMVWLFCSLLSIPEWKFFVTIEDSRYQDKIECAMIYPSYYWSLYNRLLYHILGFALPALIMLFCSSSILLRLRHGSQVMQKKEIRVIVALILSFIISWTPYNITFIIDTIQSYQTIESSHQTSCESTIRMILALTITSTLGYLNCCVKPVLYVFFWAKFS